VWLALQLICFACGRFLLKWGHRSPSRVRGQVGMLRTGSDLSWMTYHDRRLLFRLCGLPTSTTSTPRPAHPAAAPGGSMPSPCGSCSPVGGSDVRGGILRSRRTRRSYAEGARCRRRTIGSSYSSSIRTSPTLPPSFPWRRRP
jgi:hypothetical protein